MKEFGETDNNDFNDMFNLIEEEKLSEDMKIFYNVQKQNLGKRAPNATDGTQSKAHIV